jgi:hypothetical protein
MEPGHLELARWLDDAGAPTSTLDEVERFVSLCIAGDESGARAILERAADPLARAPKEIVLKAAHVGESRR